ncbi:oxygenase MpaB family protein [Amycolatopsis sp. NPDC059021]|uniref:oxygenase MpaB family protein n=1 Tax=Amycolatopsis sp. NPDC059021 TaxID=3346704 RepID=UPI003672A5D3
MTPAHDGRQEGRAADEPMFGPDSVTRQVIKEPFCALGGFRALFLQALHPRTVAAVEQNSAYRRQPLQRLAAVRRYLQATTAGTVAEARAAGDRLRAVHATLTAYDPVTGEEYRVDSPDLLRWVHVVEVESYLDAALRTGLRLSPQQVDAYYAEQTTRAALVSLDPATVPDTAQKVADYYDRVRADLHVTKEAVSVAAYLVTPRVLMPLNPLTPIWAPVALAAYAMLPAWARALYGIAGPPATDQVLDRVLGLAGSLAAGIPAAAWDAIAQLLPEPS